MTLRSFWTKVLIITVTCSVSLADNDEEYREAGQKAGEAFYVQSGLNSIVDNNVREIQEKLPPYCKKTLDVIVPIVDIIVKQRIELKYEF